MVQTPDTQDVLIKVVALLESLATNVERLTDAVTVLAASFAPAEERSTGCDHPADARMDISTMGNTGRFYCRVCGFRNDKR